MKAAVYTLPARQSNETLEQALARQARETEETARAVIDEALGAIRASADRLAIIASCRNAFPPALVDRARRVSAQLRQEADGLQAVAMKGSPQ